MRYLLPASSQASNPSTLRVPPLQALDSQKRPPKKPHPFVSGLLPITREALLELFQLSAGGLRFRVFAPHP